MERIMWNSVVNIFGPVLGFRPAWNESVKLRERWETSQAPTRRLGTIAEFRRTVRQCMYVYSGCAEWYERRTFEKIAKLTPNKASNDVVGDTQDVSYLFPPKHRIGHVIEEDVQNGLSMETIETLRQSLTVLRSHGRIISAYISTIIRHESRGGSEII